MQLPLLRRSLININLSDFIRNVRVIVNPKVVIYWNNIEKLDHNLKLNNKTSVKKTKKYLHISKKNTHTLCKQNGF